MPLGSTRGSPQWGAGHARRDPAAGRSDVQTKSPARAATSLALIAWCRRRSPPPDAANDYLLNRKKVMPRRPPPSRVRGRVARTHHSPLTKLIPTPIFPRILPRSFPRRTGRGRPHRYAGEARCVEKRGLLVRGLGAELRHSPGTGSGPAHPQRRDRFHPHQAPATGPGRGDKTGPRLCGDAPMHLRVTRLRTRFRRKEPRRALLCAAHKNLIGLPAVPGPVRLSFLEVLPRPVRQ